MRYERCVLLPRENYNHSRNDEFYMEVRAQRRKHVNRESDRLQKNTKVKSTCLWGEAQL